MKSREIVANVVVDQSTNKKKPSLVYKTFKFNLKNVTGHAESLVQGHTDIVIPGGVFTIDLNYAEFDKIYNNYKDETEKD